MKKVSLTILLLVVMVLSSITVVNATDNNAVFSLTTESTDVKVGDEITVNIVIDSITGFDGIRVFRAKKVFDSTIFEYLGAEGQNGWEVKGDATAIVIQKATDSNSGIIATMKFRILKVSTAATIQLTELDATGTSGEDVYFEDGNVNSPILTLRITEKATEEEPGDETNTVTNTETNTETNTASGTTNKVTNNDKTTATGNKIPQTGESYITVTLIVIAIVVAGILYAKYKTYENKMK